MPSDRRVGSGAPRVGDLLADRYDLTKEIGRGGMGRVYCAHDRVLGRDVAVKILIPAASAAWDDVGDLAGADGPSSSSDFQRASLREARSAARLIHPGIVTIFDTGTYDGSSYLVMELIRGPTLRRVLHDEGVLPPARAVKVAADVADALEYAHRHAVLHCDVKPHNIIVTSEGRKLVDFGIARAAHVTAAFGTGEVYGSLPYLAPEQARGEPLDARTDVYALGSVLYEMLTGRPPFVGDNMAAVLAQRLSGGPPAPRSLNRAISPKLEQIMLTALERDPARRYASAGQFRDALRRMAPGLPVTADAPTLAFSQAQARSTPPAQEPSWSWGGIAADWLRSQGRNSLALGVLALGGVAVLLGLGLLLASLVSRPPPAGDATPSVAAAPPPPQGGAPPIAGPPSPPAVAEGVSVAGRPSGSAAGAIPTGGNAARPEPALPGVAWATFVRKACQWSSLTSPPGICFGERDAGYRVRVMNRDGGRWLVWDPETRNVAYVNPGVLRPE